MKKILQEFKQFAMRGNVVDMAVGIIIGVVVNSGLATKLSSLMMKLGSSGMFLALVLSMINALRIGQRPSSPQTSLTEALAIASGAKPDIDNTTEAKEAA